MVEQELNGIEHLLYMESSSEQGIGTITLTFEAGTNLDVASVETQNRIKRAEARLPDDVRRVGITVAKSARNYLMFIALISPDKSRDNVALGSYTAANILENIRRLPGVGEAILFGTEYSMRLWLKPDRLHAYNLSPGDVSTAVRAQNTQLATGELGQLPAAQGQQLNAVHRHQEPTVHAGRIRQHHRARQPGWFHGAGQGCGTCGTGRAGLFRSPRVSMGSPQQRLQFACRLPPMRWIPPKPSRPRWTELAKAFPKGVDWLVPYDTSRFVEISIREVVMTLAQAMVLVFLVIYLFLGNLRATFIPAIVVPVALTGGYGWFVCHGLFDQYPDAICHGAGCRHRRWTMPSWWWKTWNAS